jgi:perosamine synthetase|tara:strand:- start:27 stop:1163 length:1137 start_codon:yes stop_codon:yes gene_type:complete
MDNWKLPLYKIYSDDEDLNLITKIIKRGEKWAIGPEIDELEKSIANYIGVDYCIALNSGTSALHSLLLAYGLGKNDDIILPSFSFISTANSVLFVDANPIFVDIEEDTFGLDPSQVLENLSSSVKAIMPIDYAGMSCKIFDIKKIADDNNLVILEDAAEGLGSSINGKRVGSVSNSAIFSFCGNKVLTTGEGGAVVTHSKEIAERIKLIRSHGRVDKNNYFDDPSNPDYLGLGYNWRMSAITASLGLSQMSKLDKLIKMRQDNANYLSTHLSKHSKIKVPSTPNGYEHTYQMYTIRLPDKSTRDSLHDFLTTRRIFSKVYFTPIHTTTFYQQKFGDSSITLPITEKISQQVLTLPLYPNMTIEEKDLLVQTISEFFES